MIPFPDKKYDVIYTDPPWNYYGDPNKMAAAGKHYNLMDQEELFKLPVQDIMHKNSAMFMWATGPRLDYAIDLIKKWGLNYRGVAYVWIKTTKQGMPFGAAGVRPTFTKPLTEFVLVASNIKTGRPLTIHTESQRQTVFNPPTRHHSEKPEVVRQRIDELCGEVSKLEMFSRKKNIPGWDFWGNEVGKLGDLNEIR